MNLKSKAGLHLPKYYFRRASQSGIALVLVLGMLALIVVLMVAFLGSVSTELRSAKTYASGLDAKSLADSSVNIVISQIQDATATPQYAWASQPGMIRTYDNTGSAVAAYKLYSSDNLRISGAFHAPNSLANEVPPTWAQDTELFTDLNKPVTVSGNNHYPILDPSAVGTNASGGAPLEGTGPAIEGCFLDTSASVTAGQTNPLPMPVRWMYVLKDGRITDMNSASKKVNGASKTNPIVGRMAFWTDDESCKVNVNTASEGTYWDRPWVQGAAITGTFPDRTSTSHDPVLSINIPAQNEFQRYPGHPAMTSLSAVFPPLAGELDATTGQPNLTYKKRIYGILPRIAEGGSQSGTKNVNQTTTPIVSDKDRLFPSVDEFLFQVTSNVTSSNSRKANLKGGSTDFSEDDIEKTRFFLTATSRAPEVNLFNKPRISLWPLQISPDPDSGAITRNSKDKLIAFCSTVGSKPYYFQRYNTYTSLTQNPIPSSQSPTMDWSLVPRNQELYAYLQSLTSASIPGLGGSFSAKYPNSRDQILTEMFDFVRSNVNTFSSAEAPKYYYTHFNPSGMVTGQSQIVPLALPNGTKGFGRFPTITEAAVVFYRKDKLYYRTVDNAGNPTSPPIEAVQGANTITGKIQVVDTPAPEAIDIGAVLILEPFNPSPGPPTWSSHVNYVVRNLNGITLTGSTEVTPFQSGARNIITGLDAQNNATALTGFEQCFQYKSTTSGKFVMPKTLGTDPEKNYPFYAHFSLPNGTTTMTLSSANIAIDIYSGDTTTFDSSTLVQTINMHFPSVLGLPVPTISYSSSYNSGTNITTLTVSLDRSDYDTRISRLKSPPGNGRYGVAEDNGHEPLPFVVANGITGDVVRSVEARYGGPARGDYRIFTGLKLVPDTFFEGHGQKDTMKGTSKSYFDTSTSAKLIHSLTIDGMSGSADTSNQNGYYAGAGGGGDTRGKLVAAVTYPDPNRGNNARNRKVPIVPRGLDAAIMDNGSNAGDWDTGLGAQPDGPYINPADQSSANTSQISSSLYYTTGGYINGAGVVDSGSSFSPNRQISSAAAFGSLPSGIDQSNPDNSKPWQTLLFCKNPAAGSSHPGFGLPASGPPYTTAPDHAFLDLFTMPIVEPYAISEPFSTAGKINMNYQIVPFTYLTRSTGLRAVLKSTNIMAIPTTEGLTYKLTNAIPDMRYTLDPDELTGTLQGFKKRFDSGDIFRSASEICDIFLVPKYRVNTTTSPSFSPSYNSMASWWNNFQLTGDNVREQPYGHLYPRLTTKSNTYTVHVMTQSLKKGTLSTVDEFDDSKDQVTGEFRGSFIIERYLDPNSDTLVLADGRTPGTETDPNAMVGPYKFRIVSSKRFAP